MLKVSNQIHTEISMFEQTMFRKTVDANKSILSLIPKEKNNLKKRSIYIKAAISAKRELIKLKVKSNEQNGKN